MRNERPLVLQRLGQMSHLHRPAPGQVGDAARHLEHPMHASARPREPPGRPFEKRGGAFVESDMAIDTRRVELCVGATLALVIDLLLENLERLWRGEAALRNQFV